jgi:kinesin family protein 4/21/27
VILGKDKPFTYDYAFPSDATQNQIFTQSVEPLVETFFKGYHATILAYGQTGKKLAHHFS